MKYIIAVILVIACFGSAGCSGGGTGATEVGNPTSTTTLALSDLTSSPTLDVSNYDFSQTTASASLSKSADKSVSGQLGNSGDFSQMGCQLNQLKNEAIRHGKMMQTFNCFLENLQTVCESTSGSFALADATGTCPSGYSAIFTVPTDSYTYVHALPPPRRDGQGQGPGGGRIKFDGKVRLGIFTNTNGANQLEIDICNKDPETNSDALMQQIRYSLADTTFTGSAVYAIKHPDPSAQDLSTASMVTDKAEFNITVNKTTTGSFDFKSADITDTFNGAFGNGEAHLLADATDMTNTVTGAFTNTKTPDGNTVNLTAQVSGKFNSTEGCGQFAVSGSTPAFMIPIQPFTSCTANADCTSIGGTCGTIITPRGEAQVCSAAGCYDPRRDTQTQLVNDMCVASYSGVEPFSINVYTYGGAEATDSYTGLKELTFTIAATNDFCSDASVTGALPDVPTTVDIEFTAGSGDSAVWDCTVPSGQAFIDVDLSNLKKNASTIAAAFSACNNDADAMDERIDPPCMQQSQQNNADRADQKGPPPPTGGQFCKQNSDCGTGFLCPPSNEEGTPSFCVKSCTTNTDCNSNDLCLTRTVGTVCVPTCSVDTDCPAGLTCQSDPKVCTP